jgi:adenine phosphoribosyltransferase
MDLAATIRNIPDFPKPGIQFKDITTLLLEPAALREVIDIWVQRYEAQKIDAIVGVEARGFIFGTPLAYVLKLPFIPARKKGKLPGETISAEFDLEYGTDIIEIHRDALQPGQRVVIIDDLLATGGTVAAVRSLIEQLEAEVVEAAFVVELPPLGGRKKLNGMAVHSLVEFMVD